MSDVYQEMINRSGFVEDNDLTERLLDEVEAAENRQGIWGYVSETDDEDVRYAEMIEAETGITLGAWAGLVLLNRDLCVVSGIAHVACKPLSIMYTIPYHGVTLNSNELPVLPTPVIWLGEDDGECFRNTLEQVDPFRNLPVL